MYLLFFILHYFLTIVFDFLVKVYDSLHKIREILVFHVRLNTPAN